MDDAPLQRKKKKNSKEEKGEGNGLVLCYYFLCG